MALALSACIDPVADPVVDDLPADLKAPLPTAGLVEQGIDTLLLASALDRAATLPNLRRLVLVRNGFVVLDSAFEDRTALQLDSLHTATLSVVSALVGYAIADGFFDTVHQPIRFYLDRPELTGPKAGLTIRHLLTMTAGLEWDDDDLPLFLASDDPVGYVLSKPLVSPPGDTFAYNPALGHVLSAMLTNVTGRSTAVYARDRFFDELGITRFDWTPLTDGITDGTAGLALDARDWAKVGVLLLQRGLSGRRRVFPQTWLDQMIGIQEDVPWTYPPLSDVQFGFLWWRTVGAPGAAVFAWGYGGQILYVVPDLELVVVTTASPAVTRFEVDDQQRQIFELIVEGVAPAVRP